MRSGYQGVKAVPTEQQPVHADRRHQQHRRADLASDRDQVHPAHNAVELGEALLERKCQQEPGEQRDTGLRDSQFLQQAGPIAVQPFGFRLVAVRVPTVITSRTPVVHSPIVAG